MAKKKFNIVLITPEIPGNTGSIGRTCVALGLRLILIKPYGFDLSEKAVRRAGLDYWKHVEIKEYESFEDFIEQEKPKREALFLFENHKEKYHYDAGYSEGCYLIFGAETKGIPDDIMQNYSDRVVSLPQFSPHIRSLNLSNAATAAAYECLRCL
ncbi:MAG: tRNA (uridine(34)/cytosine(34)/5-carboxymethylaminomethyluridine(34)-2'-O)-methyltransferase TrmL [Halobacteriovoraceae bacterium]|nr:tRNA (uridine(34)/cytosine(34)/5-carboxymethylaminomethyluridine(34)-2'-O)-methyltransferase TrmL [Halobacteriovoraceae bacterium]|tara:strand:+ start:8043 stop:8507 length:465 start_codon:yes stop_codon:yes gene_type:complete